MLVQYLINVKPLFVAYSLRPDEVMIVRYVQPLTDEQRALLEKTMKQDPAFRARSRAQSLHDQPRSGRPSKLTPDEQELVQQYIKEEPRSLKGVGERFANKTEQRLSLSTLKRLAKKARLRWKRVRKSLKSLRDPKAFACCQRELIALQKQEDQGKIDLY